MLWWLSLISMILSISFAQTTWDTSISTWNNTSWVVLSWDLLTGNLLSWENLSWNILSWTNLSGEVLSWSDEYEIENTEQDDSHLPQIKIDEETNTIYITWWNINSWANDTGSVIDGDNTLDGIKKDIEIDEIEEISPEDEFTNALAWMYANGLTMYDNKEEFRPKDFLTREEASKIIWQAYSVLWYKDLEKNQSCVFSDEDMFNETLSEHIKNVCKRWLFKWSDGKFMPQNILTKAQSMAVLVRMFEGKMSYELQTPWWAQYYEKGKLMWLTNSDNINEFDHNLSRYEIALMIYRLKKIVTNDQLKIMALNALNNIEVETSTWTIDAETVIENLDTLVGGIDPNTDPELLEAIYWMYDNWLTMYKTPTEYNPFGTLTKAWAAKIFDKFSNMLWLGVDEAYLTNDCEFTDIEDLDETTKVHILNVCKKWLIKWWNGLFSPNEIINKSHFIVALIRMFEGKHLDETISPRWKNYFDEAQKLWLVSTSDSITFDTPISRYEVALFVYKFNIKYKMLNNLNNSKILNEVITTVEWSIWTGSEWKLKANVYVDANLLKDWNFDVWYIEIFGTRYKIIKSSEETYFTDNFVRYGDIFDMVTDESLGSINFLVSNGYVIEGVIRFTEGKNYKVSWIKWTNAYYEIDEQ